jgi:hypothetical protein
MRLNRIFSRPNTASIALYLMLAAVVGWVSITWDTEATAMDLDQFKWKNRLLFVFASAANDPNFGALRREIAAQPAEVTDRDLVVFEILDSGASKMNGSRLDPQSAAFFRDHFAVGQKAFTLILVGKDGGVKLRRHDRVALAEIFALIDSMPMRKEEMRQKGR